MKKTSTQREAIEKTRLSDLYGALDYNPSGVSLDNMADELTQPIDLSNVDKSTRECNDDGSLEQNQSDLYNPSVSLDCMANELTQPTNISNVNNSATNSNDDDDMCLVSLLSPRKRKRKNNEKKMPKL